ncbi:10898_t:CDS:2, partial [Gigaspora rosea]
MEVVLVEEILENDLVVEVLEVGVEILYVCSNCCCRKAWLDLIVEESTEIILTVGHSKTNYMPAFWA